MRRATPNAWLGFALLFALIPRAEAAPSKGAASPVSAAPSSSARATAPSAPSTVTSPTSSTATPKGVGVVGAASAKSAKSDPDDKGVSKTKPRPTAPRAAKLPSTRPATSRGEGQRRAGTPGDDAQAVVESPELRALRDADRELFRPGTALLAGAWPNELPGPIVDPSRPVVRASGLAPTPPLPEAAADQAHDLSWLRSLALPDISARWDARVLRYLGYYHDEPRGRSLLQGWMRKSGRYGATIRRVFRDRGLPDDLVWVALVESGFDPAIRSSAGAAGLWQLMPEGARAFGLAIDRWVDERYDAERATDAAARYLADLHRRLGNWELALAAYNMGYGALLNAIRKYNTNDFWELTKFEAGVPYETALYVPKIIAVAVAARNPSVFGLDSVRVEPPLAFDPVAIPSGTTVQAIANAAGVLPSAIEALNPQLRKGRTPPLNASSEITSWTVRVPQGKGIAVSRKFAPRPLKGREGEADDTAASALDSALATTDAIVPEPDARRPDDPQGHGALGFAPNAMPSATAMLPPVATVPGPAAPLPPAAAEKSKAVPLLSSDEKPVVVHAVDPPRFAGRTRFFYRVAAGDTVRDIATAFRVTADDLGRWNPLDPSARLQEGMSLQVFVKDGTDLSRVPHLSEADVRCLTVASEEFFAYFESLRGRKRTAVVIEEGDTWERLAKRFNLTLGQLERINQRSRSEKLVAKETVVVYAPVGKNVTHQAELASGLPAALGPVVAPNPEDLPDLPDVPDMETSDIGADVGFGPSAESRRLTR